MAERAYRLWENDGCPPDRDLHYWLLAEKQLIEAAGRSSTLIDCPVWTAIMYAVKDCIRSHGPITKDLLTSVTKRIYYALHCDHELLKASPIMLSAFSNMILIADRFCPPLELRRSERTSLDKLEKRINHEVRCLKEIVKRQKKKIQTKTLTESRLLNAIKAKNEQIAALNKLVIKQKQTIDKLDAEANTLSHALEGYRDVSFSSRRKRRAVQKLSLNHS